MIGRASAILSVKASLAGVDADASGAAFLAGVVLVVHVDCDGQGFVFGQADESVLAGQDLSGQLS
ncbi:MAG: hypothetical protein L0K07_09900 [Yaniella sp.]|uniref:hypothetical protein n=1 Tax=Yaniella sp. TaxID=2773929 RepID=UPI0026499303|nr:hypothetical protein [Yaniella sp.]MDN5731635.1 hypothetical protein [Yaniella sp.]MDN5816282.1 hypothetical protein [Yaniella sp.]MDN5837487.1 hypothetical protein [Yaniella sp.]MDN5889708.1 hypothetical protein [Yaniella sp.]MDN5913125.1 hypothetical protein [Yaniella sp.]